MKDPKCPNCNGTDIKEIKSWKLIGGKGDVKFRVHLYECNLCTLEDDDGVHRRFRKFERI